MHYYQHNIKAFNNATRHLTRVERALYRDLIELYYDTEQPLPAVDFDRLARRVMANSGEEKAALQYVLDEFFELTGEVYTHTRCDEEIESYRESQSAKARAGKASAEARKKKAELRKQQRKEDSEQNATGVQHTLNKCATNQEPLTINQEPIRNTKTPCASDDAQQANCEAKAKAACRFDDWWMVYPVKRNKKKTLEIWKRRKLDGIADLLIDDVKKRAANDHDWIRGFTPHPTTYLNGDRWNDEITRPTEKHSSQSAGRSSGSALDKVLSGIEAARQGRHGESVGHDDSDVRPQMGEQLRREGRPDGSMGSVIEGDYTRND